ncbi:dihydropteroate synthase [Bacteriovorax sp. Seq25_V]|uniref:dihydropteroate synthase n=1 Tax=Bacteriovorax sp. Seq25_V TaxID=1201288 RepID=UPI000389FD8C|nr:dihydropteroate synthase [Bacteriovorax sp. Seq25_V]EQC44178.1 putative dihydropteroate synthase [Bacteriovorax sp. Seq25_V]
MPNNKVQIMGVINLTPNSFSDGGEHLSGQVVADKIKSFTAYENHIIDIGVESTAPFNDSISFKEEVSRLDEFFFPRLLEFKKLGVQTFSFDTYKHETMTYILEKLSGSESDFKIIWNDVSGVIDQELVSILNKYPEIEIVISHNLAGKRAFSGEHMDYVDESLTTASVISFFKKRVDKLVESGIEPGRVWCDPCFGFSKTQEQNYLLLDEILTLTEFYPKWLIGISRKSFLQKLVPGFEQMTKDQRIIGSEVFHQNYLANIVNTLESKEIIFRVHDPKSLSFLQIHS